MTRELLSPTASSSRTTLQTAARTQAHGPVFPHNPVSTVRPQAHDRVLEVLAV
jgi:hypothetical protein